MVEGQTALNALSVRADRSTASRRHQSAWTLSEHATFATLKPRNVDYIDGSGETIKWQAAEFGQNLERCGMSMKSAAAPRARYYTESINIESDMRAQDSFE